MRRLLLLSGVAALVLCAGVAAHGPGADQGYVSKVEAVRPALPGIRTAVIDGDERLQLGNSTNQAVLVLGYSNEPYLRITSHGVYDNQHSPATYLNQDRYAKTPVPASASNPNAPPKWVKVASGSVYSWHDHRIHWMSTIPPPQVRADPKKSHHVFDWSVPLKVNGRAYSVVGTLDYVPPKK